MTFVVNWYDDHNCKHGKLGILDVNSAEEAEKKFSSWYPHVGIISVYEDDDWGVPKQTPDPLEDVEDVIEEPKVVEPPVPTAKGLLKVIAEIATTKRSFQPEDIDEEYWERLERHDWYYDFSDDNRVWKAGKEEADRLKRDAKQSAWRKAALKAYQEYVNANIRGDKSAVCPTVDSI